MKVSGVKATGFASGNRSRRHEIEMLSGSETVTRRAAGLECTLSLSSDIGEIRLTLDETEMRDWIMRLTRALDSKL